MNPKTYLKAFSLSLRWRLSAHDAQDILSDYEDMLSQASPAEESTLVQKWGTPHQAAKLLSHSPAYHRWLGIFCTLLLCLFLPLWMLWHATPPQNTDFWLFSLLLIGILLSLFWFRVRERNTPSSRPKWLLPALLLPLPFLLLSAGVLGSLAAELWNFIPPPLYGRIAQGALLLSGTMATLTGVAALLLARIESPRWCTLYILCLTTVILCLFVYSLLTSMSLDTSAPNWFLPYLMKWGICAGIGILGVGVSLC